MGGSLESFDDLRLAVTVFSLRSAVESVQSFAFPSPARRGRGKQAVSLAQSFMVWIINRFLFHFSIHTAISCAPSGRLVRPLGGRGTSLAKRRLDDPACIGGAGAPPSQRPNYFRIDLEMELGEGAFFHGPMSGKAARPTNRGIQDNFSYAAHRKQGAAPEIVSANLPAKFTRVTRQFVSGVVPPIGGVFRFSTFGSSHVPVIR
jgi:hypothetical protein